MTIDGSRVGVQLDLRRGNTPFLAGRIDGDVDSGEWSVEGFQLGILESKGFAAEGPVEFTLTDQGASDVKVRIVSPDGLGDFSITGTLDPSDPDLHMTARKIRLGSVRELALEVLGEEGANLPEFDIDGELSMDLVVQSSPDGDANVVGWVDLREATASGIVDGVDVRLDVAADDRHAAGAVGIHGNDELLFWSKARSDLQRKDGAIMPDCDGVMRWRSMLPGVRFRDLREWLPVLGDDLDGRASMDVLVHGPACDPGVAAYGAIDMPVGVNGERVRVDLSAQRHGPEVEVELTADQDGRRIAKATVDALTRLGEQLSRLISGVENPEDVNPGTLVERFDARLAMNNADLSRLARMGGLQHPLAGVLGGGIGVSGNLDKPTVRGGLVVVNGRIGEAELSQFTVSVEPV